MQLAGILTLYLLQSLCLRSACHICNVCQLFLGLAETILYAGLLALAFLPLLDLLFCAVFEGCKDTKQDAFILLLDLQQLLLLISACCLCTLCLYFLDGSL